MTQEQQPSERRAEVRIHALYLVAYVAGSEEAPASGVAIGRTLDVSPAGAKVETHLELEPGQHLALEIAVGDEILAADGEVVYVEPGSEGLWATGLRFTSIRDEDRERLRRTGWHRSAS